LFARLDDRGRNEAPRRLPREERRGRRREDAFLQAWRIEEMTASESIPPGLRYTKDHEWAKTALSEKGGSEVTVGITAFAVEQLGDVTLVNLDVKAGDEITEGKAFGTIESVKTLSDLFAPVSGKIVRIN